MSDDDKSSAPESAEPSASDSPDIAPTSASPDSKADAASESASEKVAETPADKPAAPVATTEPAEPAFKPSFAFLGIVSAISLALDLGTKWWAKSRLEDISSWNRVVVIKDHLDFVFAKNKGGAWGLLSDENENVRRPFFLLISVAAIAFIVSLFRKLRKDQTALKWGLPLVLGGALGNLVDRIRYGHVVDFIDVYMKSGGREQHWPTFNVADIAIVVGVGLMAVDMFTSRKTTAKVPPASDSDSKPPSKDGAAGADSRPASTGSSNAS
jgi:signal peptidase II